MSEQSTAWGDLYRANVDAVSHLVGDLDDAALATTVPASPDWTVHDVIAHLAGGSDLDGNVDPLLVLRTCDLTSAQCTDVAPVPSGTDAAVLAH
ncbi:maleylpyruvate isomerase N-terminal domain-containing protein [Nocardioides hankookensis]